MMQIQEAGRSAGQPLLLVLSFWGYFFLIYRFGRVKEWFVPLVCMTGIGLTLFWGALSGAAALTADLVLAGGLAGGAVFLLFCIRGKIHLPKWNLCRCGFLLGTAAFGILSLNLELLHYDNFSHWAVIVKYLLSADRLPGADTAIVAFRDYPPGSSLFIYYVCRFAGHSRGMMLLAQNSMIFACFYAVFGIVKETRRFLLYAVLGMGCSVLSYLNITIRINNLLVDFLLPLLAMASAAVSYRCREEKGKLCLLQVILLGFTLTVKSTGAYFAGVAGIYALWEMIRGERACPGGGKESPKNGTAREKKVGCGRKSVFQRVILCVILLCGAVLPSLAWTYHVHTDLEGYKINNGTPAEENVYGQIAGEFIKAVFDPSGRAVRMLFFCIFLSALAVLYARLKMKKRWHLGRILPAVMILTALYYTGMLYMYLHSMSAGEALRLAGFERYACSVVTLAVGLLLMTAVVDMEQSFAVGIDEKGAYRAYSSPGAKRRYQYAVLGSVILAANFLYSEFNGLQCIREGYGKSLPARAEEIAGDRWYENGEADTGKYLVVAPDENDWAAEGEVRYVFRYFLWAPDVDVTKELSAGERREAEKEYDRIIYLED